MRTLETIYAKLPRLSCKGLCGGFCGLIPAFEAEEAALKALRPEPPDTGNPNCPYLTAKGRCSAYEARPLICRIWGMTKRLRCPHGCRPKRWITEPEVEALVREMETFAGPLVLLNRGTAEEIAESVGRGE